MILEIDKQLSQIKKLRRRIFSGPLMYINFDDTYEMTDIDFEFNLFESLFNSTFTTPLERSQALEYFEKCINGLGFKYYNIDVDSYETKRSFCWTDLVKYEVDCCFPPLDDSYSYHNEIEETEESIECEKIILKLLERLKRRFDHFKEIVLAEMVLPKNIIEETSKNKDEEPEELTKEIEEIMKYFNLFPKGIGWKKAFKTNQDVNSFAEILIEYFNNNKSKFPIKPIKIHQGCINELGGILRKIHLDKASVNLKNDEKFLILLKKSLSIYSNKEPRDIYNALLKINYKYEEVV